MTKLYAYQVRTGTDGKAGIYVRGYNVRLAVFNQNSEQLQQALAKVFDGAKPKVTK